ncbi:putative ABC transport system ATP-binding protein [Scopulibacillus darangshiensis]|uniref:Putative ABC transport system ATP-binding protein n=1 Tax=Scopulibacillus darangshiensis TaxID=442528 RepID=A0A4V2SNB8_9BACL|nr:ABC transporter ATP-binding protein [Scopulibacillus darangshiensis]TCP30586.1 putative ABC transport system ATP-binding protein [Scopulibacillus darangshiensis]
MKAMLQAQHVKKVFGQKGNVFTALDDIDLEIKEGEFVGVMGPSGSGKTTLLNILSTIDQPTAGSIFIDGSRIDNLKEDQLSSFRRNKLGFIFQDYNLLDTLTIEENIVLPLALAKVSAKEIDRRVKNIAHKIGIEEILAKFPYQVSGGQKQRTAASRAIIAGPSLIFADEPTGALDSKSATALLQSLSQLNEREHATIMMVTHDAFAASFCSRVLFIKDGAMFTELVKGQTSRKDYFQKILDVLSALGGGMDDLI